MWRILLAPPPPEGVGGRNINSPSFLPISSPPPLSFLCASSPPPLAMILTPLSSLPSLQPERSSGRTSRGTASSS